MIPIQEKKLNKIQIEERLIAIEVDLSYLKKKFEPLPYHQTVLLTEIRKEVEKIVSDVFENIP